ncbi:MAG: sulfatase [Gemmataceae bacterium]|nr:sulfatase [Gemmataceae bacterium]
MGRILPFVVLGLFPALADAADRKPNLVFILADDLGWMDTTPYGSKFHETPNLDRLAKRGMRFTNAYAANPLCSPTRASILTGLYPGRVGITAPVCHLPEERLEASLVKQARPDQKALQQVSATRLKPEYVTLAEVLKNAGYQTAHFGKWHLGREPYDARTQGFDVDVPHTPAAAGPGGGYLAPWKFITNSKFQGKQGEHIEDRLSQEAVQFLRQNKGRPFYLNYWAFSVHGPWTAKPELVEQYKKKADSKAAQKNPVYAAMVHSLDDAVGRLLDALDELKLADNTIVVFFSDNGGIHWHDARMKDQFGMDVPPTSNAPLRGGKATLYEGGTREPCLVVWPGKVEPGAQSDAFLSSVDFYPTLLEMIGLELKEGQHLDGVSQVPALLGKGAPRATVYCFFPHYTPATGNVPGTWVRRGDWKLIRFHHDGDGQADRIELYNLKDDLGETKNLAAVMPDKVKELNGLIEQHLKDTGVLVPAKNPRFDPMAKPTAPKKRMKDEAERGGCLS